MVGAIISAAAGVGAMVYGGIKSAQNAKKAKQQLERQEQEARLNFNRDYYADLTQRADMRYLLNKQREQLTEANTAARQRNVVAGGTTEAEAVAKKTSNKALAESTARIGALSQQQKQAAVANYNAMRQGINTGYTNMYNTQATNAANLATTGAGMLVKGAAGIADDLTSDATTTTADSTDTTTSTTPSQPQGEVVTTQEYQEANPTHAMDEAVPEDNSLTGDEYKDMWFK
ncbi:MAG: hypothetical protein UH853_00290 [Muribaculaceae bacterium]|nr:hypothetical protein [Muribaculaceae bacterium]